jgi:hypothetical protein
VALGPDLRDGFYSVDHAFDHVASGDPEYQPAHESRTYELLSYVCASETSCTATFRSVHTDTGDVARVRYRWNGEEFTYGPRAYSDGRSCLGESNGYNVQQTVRVHPTDFAGDAIQRMTGQMTVTGNVTSAGSALGCTDYQVVFTTEIVYLGAE